MKVVIITGMSGSGKSKALNFFEDNGYYCLDNLPVKLLADIIRMLQKLEGFSQKVCVTMDVRDANIAKDAPAELAELRSIAKTKLVFLECEDGVLLKRYKETRRLHPLMMTNPELDLAGAIAEERLLLTEVRQSADCIVDTSLTTSSELREKLKEEVLRNAEASVMQINFVAFGYKYGLSADFDLVFDVRCLPNPFYVDELKTKNGADKEVQDFVMSHEVSKRLMQKIVDYLECALPMYEKEGKAQLVVGLGCTGGQHRSLTFALLLAEHFEKMGFATHAYSRDSRKNVSEIGQR
ncbi:MAG: RNase adapter RapZ [Lachnospiraceae bacterium]|nr:RNase adapter RapZ [Lachnospiraceae bacterium]